MNWKTLLESVSESVNDQLRLRHDYLVAENRILRNQIDGCVKFTDSERKELAEIGTQLGKPALAEIATVAQADTILAWHRKFATQTVDTSAPRKSVGRPRVDQEIEAWVIRMARENRSWGYDRIQGSLKHLGYTISDQTVGNILKRHGIPPAPERKNTVTWREFIRSHWDVLVATGFFNSEVWGWLRWVMSFIFFFFPFSRGWKRAMGAMVLINTLMMSISSRFLHLRINVGMWQVLLKKNRPLQPRWPRKVVLLCRHSEWRPPPHRECRSSGVGKGVLASPLKDGRIRDGPNQPWPVTEAA